MRPLVFLLAACAAAGAQTIGIDTHIDTPQRVLIEGADLSKRLKDGQVDLPRLKEGGMNAPFFALWVPTFYRGSEAVRRTLDLRDAMQALFDAHPELIELAVSAADIEVPCAKMPAYTISNSLSERGSRPSMIQLKRTLASTSSSSSGNCASPIR